MINPIELKKMKWEQESDIKWVLKTSDDDFLCEVVKSKFKAFFVKISHRLRDNDDQIRVDTLVEAQDEFIEIYRNRLSYWVNIFDDKEYILQNIINPFEEEIEEEDCEEITLEAVVEDDDSDDDLDYDGIDSDYEPSSNDSDDDSEPFIDWEEESRKEYDDYLQEESKRYIDDTPYGDSTDSPIEEEDDQYDGDDSDDD